jgi:hypothetical protein
MREMVYVVEVHNAEAECRDADEVRWRALQRFCKGCTVWLLMNQLLRSPNSCLQPCTTGSLRHQGVSYYKRMCMELKYCSIQFSHATVLGKLDGL